MPGAGASDDSPHAGRKGSAPRTQHLFNICLAFGMSLALPALRPAWSESFWGWAPLAANHLWHGVLLRPRSASDPNIIPMPYAGCPRGPYALSRTPVPGLHKWIHFDSCRTVWGNWGTDQNSQHTTNIFWVAVRHGRCT